MNLHIVNTHGQPKGCDKCDYETYQDDQLLIHTASEHSLKVESTSCNHCEFDGSNKEDLDAHLKTNHKANIEDVPIAGNFILTEFFCKTCDFTAETENGVSEHVVQKHMPWFNCDLCDYKTKEKHEIENQLESHQHRSTKTSDASSVSTEDNNGSKEDTANHQSPGVTFFDCTSCEFRTKIFSEFKIHIDTKHSKVQISLVKVNKSGEQLMSCDKCRYTCKYNIQLKKHCIAKHQQHYECNECSFATGSYESIVDHKTLRHSAKDFRCDICEYSTPTPFEMFIHKVAMHEAYQQFNQDSVFAMQELFLSGLARKVDNVMETVSSNQNQDVKKICSLCNFGSTDVSILKKHEETHIVETNPLLVLRALTELTTVVRGLANDIVAIKSDSIIINTDVYSNIKEEVIQEINENVNNKCGIIDKRVDHLHQKLGNLEDEISEQSSSKKARNAETATTKDDSKDTSDRHKVAWIGTSISKVLDAKKFEKDLNVELSMTKAYCVEEEGKFPKSNFKAIAPEAAKGADTLVLETGSIEITNIDVNKAMENHEDMEVSKKEWFDKVEASSTSLFKIAEECATADPNLTVVIVKRPPRFDVKSRDTLGIKSKLSEFGNKIYDQLLIKSNLSDRIHVIELNLLQNSNQLRTIIYGTHDDPRFDGVHFVGGAAASRHFTYRVVQSLYPIIQKMKIPRQPQVSARKSRNMRKSGIRGTKNRHFRYNNNQQQNHNTNQSGNSPHGERSEKLYSDVLQGDTHGFSQQSDLNRERGFKRNNFSKKGSNYQHGDYYQPEDNYQHGDNYQNGDNYQHGNNQGSSYNIPVRNRFQGNW